MEPYSKRLRLFELLLVLLIPLLPSLLSSVYTVCTRAFYRNAPAPETDYSLVVGMLRHVLAIALLLYVLFRQGRRVEDIGLSFRMQDIPIGLAVYAVAHGIYYLVKIGLRQYHLVAEIHVQNVGFMQATYLLVFLYSFINPFFEELIVRAYGMSEIEYLSGSKTIAIVTMTLFQASYHLYQGLWPALLLIPVFLVYSLYYAKYKRIMPVIIAHMIADMVALVMYQR